jgi:quercetin dioxygenase-like cupin family protein
VTHTQAMLDSLAPFALGLPDADPGGTLAAHLAEGCEICTAEVRELRETATLLLLATEPVPPPEALSQRVLDRIAGKSFEFVLSNEGTWRPAGQFETKMLYDGPLGSTSLISLPTGSWLADAYQPGHLGYVILRGELDGEGVRLNTADFVPAAGKVPGRRMAVVMDTVLLAVAGAVEAEPLDSPRAVRASKAAWTPMEPGVSALPVAGSEADGIEISLLRLEPGAVVAKHRHDWVEEFCLISGDCRCQGVELGPEDYHRAVPGTSHDATTSVGGCTMVYIIRKITPNRDRNTSVSER